MPKRNIGARTYARAEFFAQWCGHCKDVAPKFREAAQSLHQLSISGSIPMSVKLAKFDAPRYQNEYDVHAIDRWNISSYPSMFLVGRTTGAGGEEIVYPYEEGEKKVRYTGYQDPADALVFFMTRLAEGLNQTEAWDAFRDVELREKPGMYKIGGKHETDDVTELDIDTFEESVLRSDAVWIVEFYSDKCPICNSIAPEYIRAAKEAQEAAGTGGRRPLRYGAVNSRLYQESIADKFGVTSYPWITSFYLGKNRGHMNGVGDWTTMYNWGMQRVGELWDESATPVLDAAIPPKEEERELDDGGETRDAPSREEL